MLGASRAPLSHSGPRPCARHTLTEVAHACDAYGLAGGGGDGAGGSGSAVEDAEVGAVWNCEEIWASRVGFGFVRAAAPPAGIRIVRPHDEASAKRTPRPVTASIPRQEDLSRLLSSLGARARLRTTREHFGSSGLQHRHEQQHHFGLPASRCALARSASALDKQRQSGGLGRVGMRCASSSRHASPRPTAASVCAARAAADSTSPRRIHRGSPINNLKHQERSSAPRSKPETECGRSGTQAQARAEHAVPRPPSPMIGFDITTRQSPQRHTSGGATSVLVGQRVHATTVDDDHIQAPHKWIGIATQTSYDIGALAPEIHHL
ncbi:unnamed protein product [Tilletia laevis]|uniref:Uncharacterized protein n=3 Tax=Tilletia TaxID=13289 RepID=A0A8X7MIJ4_9BASI|nr:hypothetical protein A4X06_0g9478 [Tilletia controversa]KAE8263228.1 hypothetical protein A4X03_0g1837 [Tilletia caries]CAD6951728.1 unnamed protein product [Tilletia caries]CAD6958211.1 unnamed protein product [Tilletia laevis]